RRAGGGGGSAPCARAANSPPPSRPVRRGAPPPSALSRSSPGRLWGRGAPPRGRGAAARKGSAAPPAGATGLGGGPPPNHSPESPAAAISDETRAGLYKAALTVANAVNYVSAGTVEFLVASDGTFYFIEMNTRIQVEHPVTEMLTGLDIVREQIRIASGEPLGYKQKDIEFRGHAIECRINAEDPEHFIPAPGTVTAWRPPGGHGVRVDSHMMPGAVITPYYDSLIAKIIVHGRDRAEAISR